jgi:hypothetical protein
MLIVFFWLGFSIAAGMLASIRRNRSGLGWFLLSILISPLLAMIFLLILPTKIDEIRISTPASAVAAERKEWTILIAALVGCSLFGISLTLLIALANH